MAIRFLKVSRVLQIHRDQIKRHAGEGALRDAPLLESAVLTPASSFGGKHLHEFPHGMAAAYLFHVVQNHPFVDGNKRTGFATALMFLDLNGFELECDRSTAENLVLSVAKGELSKTALTDFFREHVVERPS